MPQRPQHNSHWCLIRTEPERIIVSVIAFFVTAAVSIIPLFMSINYLTSDRSEISTVDAAAGTQGMDLGAAAEGIALAAGGPVVLAISGIIALAVGVVIAIVVYSKTVVDRC